MDDITGKLLHTMRSMIRTKYGMHRTTTSQSRTIATSENTETEFLRSYTHNYANVTIQHHQSIPHSKLGYCLSITMTVPPIAVVGCTQSSARARYSAVQGYVQCLAMVLVGRTASSAS